MHIVSLQHNTENRQVNDILRGIIYLYEMLFPGRIRGYYLIGSYADRSAGSISDIDMEIVFKERFVDEAEEHKAYQVQNACALLSPIRLDIPVISEEQIRPEDVRLKLASVLLYGEDIRDNIPLPTPEAYTRYITWWPFHFLARVLRSAEVLRFPVQFPQPGAQFYGYAQKSIPAWYPPSIESGTKELVASVCWTTAALVALKTGQYIGKKADAVKAYAESIADEWTGFISDIYRKCGQHWGYSIPEDETDRALLVDLCRRTPAFENHYLSIYRAYLLQRLQAKERDAVLFAAKRLQEMIYPDQEVLDSLHAIQYNGDEELRQAVAKALQCIEKLEP